MSLVSSCRGMVVVGRTNTARTLMAEAMLRHMTQGSTFITSCGVHHNHRVHPMTLEVLEEVGVSTSGIESNDARSTNTINNFGYGGAASFDVAISLNDTPMRGTARQIIHGDGRQAYQVSQAEDEALEEEEAEEEELLRHSEDLTPAERNRLRLQRQLLQPKNNHWQTSSNATSVKRDWRIYSVVQNKNASELSTNGFTDHYSGEPLWLEMVGDRSLFQKAKHFRTWHIDPVSERRPMEDEGHQRDRFRTARDELLVKCTTLLEELSEVYAEPLLQQPLLVPTGASVGVKDSP